MDKMPIDFHPSIQFSSKMKLKLFSFQQQIFLDNSKQILLFVSWWNTLPMILMRKNISSVKVMKNVIRDILSRTSNIEHLSFLFRSFLVKNRHHRALLIHNDQLKLLIRKGPLSSNDKTHYASEWTWTLAQINDDQWHSYKIFINYPERVNQFFFFFVSMNLNFLDFSLFFFVFKIDLYVDDQLIQISDSNHQIIEDHALAIIEGTGNLVFAVGACWHGELREKRIVSFLFFLKSFSSRSSFTSCSTFSWSNFWFDNRTKRRIERTMCSRLSTIFGFTWCSNSIECRTFETNEIEQKK